MGCLAGGGWSSLHYYPDFPELIALPMPTREELLRRYGDALEDIPIVTNRNTGFRGPRGLNRVNPVDVGRLDRWIKDLSDRGGRLAERPLAAYTLPGAHDAMTYAFRSNWAYRKTGWSLFSPARGGTRTQSINLTAMFELGIRYFDIRVEKSGDKLYGFHGPITLTGDRADNAIRALFHMAVERKEPIVIKFDYKSSSTFPLVKRIVDNFATHVMPVSAYWNASVGECISQGKVLCLFHKAKKKLRKKYGDEVDELGDYSTHKAGGFTNTHNMKKHQAKLEALIEQQVEGEKLKVMSLNIPCVPTKMSTIGMTVVNALLLNIPGTLYKGGQILVRRPEQDRWIGHYKSVQSIEKSEVTRTINRQFVQKLQRYVDSWYTTLEEQQPQAILDRLAGDITKHVAGAVGMDFVNNKRGLVLDLVELNNRDF